MRVAPWAALLTLFAGCSHLAHRDTDPAWLLPDSGRASAPIAPRDALKPLRIAVYGDSHENRETHQAIIAAIRRERPDLVVFLGDALECRPVGHMPDCGALGYLIPFWPQTYAGRPAFTLLSIVPFPAAVHEIFLVPFYNTRDPEGFNSFLEDTAPLRLEDRIPFVLVPGNHDVFHDFDRREIARIFGEPGGPGGREPRALWYSRDLPGVRLIVLDSGSDTPGDYDPLERGGAQLEWLEAQLADAERQGMKSIVCSHLPPFASSTADPPRDSVRAVLGREVLERHRVALVLSGHEHVYERIDREAGDGSLRTYLVTGGSNTWFDHEAPPEERDPDSRVLVEDTPHFVMLEVAPDAISGRMVPVGDAQVSMDEFEAGRKSRAAR